MKRPFSALCAALAFCAATTPVLAKPAQKQVSSAERVGIILAAAAYGGKNCGSLIADWKAAGMAVKANGFTQADVNKDPIKGYVNRYILAFQSQPLATTCEDLYRRFGTGGSLYPNLLERVD